MSRPITKAENAQLTPDVLADMRTWIADVAARLSTFMDPVDVGALSDDEVIGCVQRFYRDASGGVRGFLEIRGLA